jgi:diguanylate cyclase (GGDEF)-like protein
MAHITNEKKQQKLYEEYISSLEERVLNNNGIFIRMNVANDQVVKIGQYALGVSKRTPAETTTQLAEHFEEFSLRSKAGKTFAEMYGKEALEEQFEQGNHDFVTYWNLQRADGTMAELAIIAALMTHPITRELEAVLQLYTKDRASSIQTGERRRVLYIQPPDRMRDSLVDALNPYFDIKVVNNCNDANLVLSLDSQYDIMLLDLASEDALAFIKETRELRKKLPLLAITDGNIPQEIAVLELGVADIQPKPVNTTLIKHRINNILEKREALLAAREDLSNRDELTGLYGRKTFIALAKELIRNAGEDEHFAMLCFDIAEFRTLNSIYGSEQCDEILKKIARMLKRTISGSLGIVMRTRADRFYAFIPKNDTLIELILEAIKDLKFGLPTDVTVRVGIYPASHEDSVETMMNNVLLPIEYLRQDKTKTVAWFDENMREADLISQRIREEFAAAIRDSKIAVYFQPKIDYKKKYYVGAEALVRWKHPDFGSITSDKYVPILEQHGLITQLDLYVLEKTCEYQRKWKDEGLRTVRVSVNFSPLDFKAPGLAEKILSIIEKYGLGYKDIRFEITETAYINDPEILTEFIDTVHAKGYLVDMDDFGSGYSSLSMLDEIHVDAVKLDMRMTRNRNNRSMHILGAIIRMAGWLKMDVIAEGVETEAQAESLRALGCVYMQGHLFDKPLPATLFRECLIKNGEKIGEVLEVIPTEIIEKGVTLENVAAMDVSDMSGLFKAIGTIFTLVISQNYTKNMYYIMEYDNFGNQTAPTRGTYDDLIQTGASTFHQEEQQSFLSTFRRENVISQFENGGDNLMHIGRQMGSDGKYHWVRTTVLLYRDGDGDIRGYALARNVDDEYSNRIASAGYQNVILGMSKAFIFVYEIDITAGLLIEIHNTEEYREFITPVSDFETSLRLMADRDLEPGEFEKNKWFWDFSDITNRIDTGSRVSALFNTRTTGWQMSTLVELERDVEGNVTKVLWLSQDVNEKIGHERHFNDVRETFADSFDLAYQIDINTGMCYEIKSDARLRKLIPPVGNVQEVIQNYLAYAVEEEYRSRMYDFINLSTLHERIKGKKRITEEYKGKLFSWLRAVIVPLTYGENGEVQQFVFGVNTIEKEKLAEYDSMTGVLNSGAATEMIEGMFIREEARDAAMLIIDIDNLKTLNDTYGHQSGTDAIIGVAKCIREQFEEEGVVGRYGGDEFIVFFKDAGNRRPELMTKIENLIRDVRRGEWIPDCTVTCTIGLAFVERDVTDFKGVFERADNALYHAKSASKNTFRIYGE